jgi:hypothetical protein
MKKYNKVTEQQVYNLIKQGGYWTKEMIQNELNTSRYQVQPIVEDLTYFGKIRLVEVDSNYSIPIKRYTI